MIVQFAKSGNTLEVRKILERESNVSQADINKALSEAVLNGHTETCRLLLENEALVDNVNENGQSLLWQAADKGHTEVCRLLLDYNAEVDLTDNEQRSALWQAATWGFSETCRVLLGEGADVNNSDKRNQSPLSKAAANGHTSTCRLFLEHELIKVDDIDEDGQSPLWHAADKSKTETCRLLLEHKADVNLADKDQYSPLWRAAVNGHIDTCKLLLEKKAGLPIRAFDNHVVSVLSDLVNTDKIEILTLILHYNKDKYTSLNNIDLSNFYLGCILHLAIELHDYKLLEELTSSGLDVKTLGMDNQTALNYAIQRRDDRACDILIKSKASLGEEDLQIFQESFSNTNTNFNDIIREHILAEKKHETLDADATNKIKLLLFVMETGKSEQYTDGLLQQGADTNITDQDGKSPLHAAIIHNCGKEIISSLINKQAYVNLEDNNGITPLDLAFEKNHIDVVDVLLRNGAVSDLETVIKTGDAELASKALNAHRSTELDVNIMGNLLHIACERNYPDVVKLIFKHCIECKNSLNILKRTPLQTAILHSSWQVVDYLLSPLAEIDIEQLKSKDINGWNSVHMSAREQNMEVTEQLLSKAPELLSEMDRHGYTPLDHAAYGKRYYHKEELEAGDIATRLKETNNSLQLLNYLKTMSEGIQKKPTAKKQSKYWLRPRVSSTSNPPSHRTESSCHKTIKIIQNIRKEQSTHSDNNVQIKNLLELPGLGTTTKTKKLKIFNSVKTLMDMLVMNMNKCDPELELKCNFHGSSCEDTKVGFYDEFDCTLDITNISSMVTIIDEMPHNVVLGVKSKQKQMTPEQCTKMNTKGIRIVKSKQKQMTLEQCTKMNTKGHIVPKKLHIHNYDLLCKSLSDVINNNTKTFPFYVKNMCNEQIHLEWVGEPVHRMAIKIDVVFGVTVPNWWPSKGRTDTILADRVKEETYILLRQNAWCPSSVLQEAVIMNGIHPIPKLGYILCKIINSLVKYTEDDQRNRIKSYHLKNALMYCVQNSKEFPWPVGEESKDFLISEETIPQIRKWAVDICKHGLSNVTGGGNFYFGLAKSSVHTEQYNKFMEMAKIVLKAEELTSVPRSRKRIKHAMQNEAHIPNKVSKK